MAASEPVPPHTLLTPAQRLLALVILSVGNFMVILDLTIANVSVPHISGELGITLEQGTWIITSYAVAEAICVPLTGWLAQRFGSVRVFMAGMIGFGVFSLLCGSSVSLAMLVACRVGQGLCGAPILPLSQSLTMRIYPPEQRTAALGTWSMTIMAAPALGPILGGLISDTVSWHWIFLINVPMVPVLVVLGWVILRPAETVTARVPIDRVGLALLMIWITCLQVMIDIGRDRDWFGDPLIVALAIGAAIGFCAFVIWELTDEHPIVDLSIFRYSAFTLAVAPFSLAYGTMFAVVVMVPQWLQATLGYTAFAAGTVTAFQAVSGIVTSAVVSRYARHFDLRLMMATGIAWMGLVALLRAYTWNTGGTYWDFALPMLLVGAGPPLLAIPLSSLTLNAVPPEKQASAAGLQTFIRTFSLAMSASFAMTSWSNLERTARSHLVAAMHPAGAQAALSSLGLGMEQTREIIAGLVDRQANTIAMNQVYTWCAAVAFVAALFVLLGRRSQRRTRG